MLTKSLGVLISIFMNVVSVFLLCVEVTRGTVYGAGEGGGFAPVLRKETTQQHQGTLTSQTQGALDILGNLSGISTYIAIYRGLLTSHI